jgi:hypothetical protein
MQQVTGYNCFSPHKCLLKECDMEENVDVTGAAATPVSKE